MRGSESSGFQFSPQISALSSKHSFLATYNIKLSAPEEVIQAAICDLNTSVFQSQRATSKASNIPQATFSTRIRSTRHINQPNKPHTMFMHAMHGFARCAISENSRNLQPHNYTDIDLSNKAIKEINSPGIGRTFTYTTIAKKKKNCVVRSALTRRRKGEAAQNRR